MKIVFDLTPLHDNFSGIERYALCISREFIKHHPEHEYILLFKEEVYNDPVFDVNKDNISAVILPPKNKLLFNQITLPKALRKIEADAYFFLAFPAPWSFKKKNTFTTIHDLCCFDCGETMVLKSRLYFRHSYKKCAKHKNTILTVSNYSKNRIHEILKIDESNIHVVYDGITDVFTPSKSEYVKKQYGLPEQYFLSVSTLEPRKNLPLLIKAYDELISSGVSLYPLVLVGRKGWKVDDLLNGISEKTKENIIFTGFVNDEHLPSIYSGAEWFIFPTKYEGFGIPPLESMACGVPVISSTATCMPEILGDAALFFENENLESLKHTILLAVNLDKNDKNALIKKGLERSKKFDWSVEAEKLAELLK